MYAIDKKFLIHSVKHNVLTTGQRGKTYGTDINLTNVLVQPSTLVVKSNNGVDQVKAKAIMFYDIINSSGMTTEFKIEDKIVFDSKEYYINEVVKAYAFDLHHYELILI
jgi:hypothetical protein